MNRLLTLLIALLLVMPAAEHTLAADKAAAVADSAVSAEEVQELLAVIDERRSRAVEIKAQHKGATGEELALAIIEILQIEDALRDALDEALANLQERQEASVDAGDLKARLVQEVTAHGKTLKEEISAASGLLENIKKQRDSVEPQGLLALEQQIIKRNVLLDRLIGYFLDNTGRAETLGIDTAADRAYLDELLEQRADWLRGQILLGQEQISDSEQQLKNALDDQKPSIQASLNAYGERLQGLSDSLSVVIKLMDKRDLDTAEYSQLLIQTTGEITTKVLDRRVAMGMLQQWLKQIKLWVIDNGPSILVKVIVVLLILLAFRMLGNFVGSIVARGIASSKLSFSKLLQDFFVTVASKAVLFLGVLIALSQLGIQLGPLLAGLGVAGFIIGFALQDTLSNFASGMMILIYRPFDVGDIIEAGGVTGKVSQMSLVSTTVLTFDNQKLVVPNNKIWGDVIRNVTSQRMRRIDMTFGIGYGDDIAHAERVLGEIVQDDKRVLEDPQPVIKLHNLGDSSVDFIVRPWVLTADYWDVYWDITRKVKERFDAEGISIPFPQRDVHLIQEAPPA
jgi:small conductance mechanosensitive channel